MILKGNRGIVFCDWIQIVSLETVRWMSLIICVNILVKIRSTLSVAHTHQLRNPANMCDMRTMIRFPSDMADTTSERTDDSKVSRARAITSHGFGTGDHATAVASQLA